MLLIVRKIFASVIFVFYLYQHNALAIKLFLRSIIRGNGNLSGETMMYREYYWAGNSVSNNFDTFYFSYCNRIKGK